MMFISADTIINNGTIGAESGLAYPVEIRPNWNDQADISNNGTIVAANGGFVVLNATSVTGSGKISLTNGGTVEIASSHVASTEKIDMETVLNLGVVMPLSETDAEPIVLRRHDRDRIRR